MAQAIQKAGKGTVYIQVYGGSLEILGTNEDQAEIVDQAFYKDVPGDAHGGPEGPPIDIQFLGQIARIRCNLSTYDKTVANKVKARLTGATPGSVLAADIGDLMIQDNKYMRALVKNANDTRNFAICIVREAVEVGLGTKYSTLICEFEAHRNQTTGLLEDTTT